MAKTIEARMHQQLLDMLGAKDQEDAARIIAGFQAARLSAQAMDEARPPPDLGELRIGINPKPGLVMAEVLAERKRQDVKWGKQNHPSFIPNLYDIHAYDAERRAHHYGVPEEHEAKKRTEARFQQRKGTYADIFIEEVAEAIGAENEGRLREELVQCAAVAVAWIECIDRRAALSELMDLSQEMGGYDQPTRKEDSP